MDRGWLETGAFLFWSKKEDQITSEEDSDKKREKDHRIKFDDGSNFYGSSLDQATYGLKPLVRILISNLYRRLTKCMTPTHAHDIRILELFLFSVSLQNLKQVSFVFKFRRKCSSDNEKQLDDNYTDTSTKEYFFYFFKLWFQDFCFVIRLRIVFVCINVTWETEEYLTSCLIILRLFRDLNL